ncbi:hypothetical protein [Halalkalibacterium halodurans]|uniref:hypothetical protein n=1 Tax=Halalkalibacterium halodurans TaxID=86665 RepID=UPI002AA98D87|nr:hypothetical protein [Halalkalibacterium halodurans]MDY7224706.1 hypothetical protein [Halalkalibacterium halodurans]MDY7243221.1 hypothetical protein [Halalkalibacterium halodurans]
MNKLVYNAGATIAVASLIHGSSASFHDFDQDTLLESFTIHVSTENAISSNQNFVNIKTQAFNNWHDFSFGLLGDSRDFSLEESVAHENALKRISVQKGKRFKI